jgi:capsular polysaccharide biosynthesis protein
LSDSFLVLPEHYLENRNRLRPGGGGLFRFERGHCIGRIPYNEKVLDRGILVGGAGSSNWYHFMIECLPKAFLAQRLPERFSDWPLLVPIEAKNCATFSDALNVFIGSRPVIYLSYSDIIKVKNLIVFDEFSISPFNLSRYSWPIYGDYGQNDEFIINYARHLQNNLIGVPGALGTQKRIFLVRPGVRRSYNQDEILDIAVRYGFQAISPENMSLTEQARLFSEAEIIIGPSGAAWVGVLFSQKPTRMLSWLPREYSQACSYSNLSKILGHEMRFIYSTPNDPVNSTDDVYLASYRVDPDAFIEALKWLER